MAPLSIVCYVCGREYGTRSVHIHLKTCQKMWKAEQDKLPRGKRRPVPPPPPGFEDMVLIAQGKKPKDDDDGGVRHKIESGLSVDKILSEYNDGMRKQCDENNLEPCPHCGRTFRPDALKKHLGSCRADAPLTKPTKARV